MAKKIKLVSRQYIVNVVLTIMMFILAIAYRAMHAAFFGKPEIAGPDSGLAYVTIYTITVVAASGLLLPFIISLLKAVLHGK